MTAPRKPRTAAATAAVIRRGQETKAAALRDAGWIVVPPETVAQLPNDTLRQLTGRKERHDQDCPAHDGQPCDCKPTTDTTDRK